MKIVIDSPDGIDREAVKEKLRRIHTRLAEARIERMELTPEEKQELVHKLNNIKK